MQDKPQVTNWFIGDLGCVSFHIGAPQIAEPGAQLQLMALDCLPKLFNNPSGYPNLRVQIEGKVIFLHKDVIARGCGGLAPFWATGFAQSEVLALDTACDATGVQVSHAAALLFFEVFYTGTLRWTGDVQVDCELAMQLLVMASKHYMQYVLSEVQQVLQHAIEVDNCCSLLVLAVHHHADHLEATFRVHICILWVEKITKSWTWLYACALRANQHVNR